MVYVPDDRGRFRLDRLCRKGRKFPKLRIAGEASEILSTSPLLKS